MPKAEAVVHGVLCDTYYLTADQKCRRVFDLLNTAIRPSFQFVHLSTPWHQTFGHLDLPE
jgi:hypothetical protein